MKYGLTLLSFLLLPVAFPLQAADKCTIEHAPKGAQHIGPWVDQDNWLTPENLRVGMRSADVFMPYLQITSPVPPITLKAAPRQLSLEKIAATDPLDQESRDIGFLLNTRLYADGLLVLRDGKVLSEQYWHELTAQQPRLLLGATRPLLSLMGAMAVTQGKLSPDKSIIRYVPALNAQAGLRKLSVQRLLEGNARFERTPQELSEWQAASGWTSGKADGGIRAWLSQAGRWDKELSDETPTTSAMTPDADLLAWSLSESYNAPLSQVFCDNLLGLLRPESPVLWFTDVQGTELSSGLALSLRDFARLGQMLVDARNSSRRSKIPSWFIETLSSSAGIRKSSLPELAGLRKGSDPRYGFLHLGGAPNRIAIVGQNGNSLYVDFDQRLVIALFATYPRSGSPRMLATLEQLWESLGSATQAPGKRR